MDNKYYIAPFILFTFDYLWLTFFMKKRFSNMIKKYKKKKHLIILFMLLYLI